MEDKISKFLTTCAKIDFGDVSISEKEKQFCNEWNKESILFFKSLPESTQTDALLFLIKYAKTSLKQLDLLKMYYVPAWSIIYWLIQFGPGANGLIQQDIKNAQAAHFMAMFLHALDDHLTDKQLPVTHLTLLLRSHAWMIMNNALSGLADSIDGGGNIVQRFIDDYYQSIRRMEEIETLSQFCECFRKQMATWLIVPVLMTKKMTRDEKFSSAVQTAYTSFGLSWRMLDDIKDIKADLINGAKSTISICLPKDIQVCRGRNSEGKNKEEISSYVRAALKYLLENNIIDNIKQRICSELEAAASIADSYEMTGLASEFRCLYKPLANPPEHL